MFFFHFMLFPTFLQINYSGNKKKVFVLEKQLFFHLMFSSCFCFYMLDLFLNFCYFFLILKNAPSLSPNSRHREF